MNAALISDLHLTAHERDAYRWELFDALIDVISVHHVTHLFILGDLTEAKDYHSSRLVNRIVEALIRLIARTSVKVIILRGNHDGLDPHLPYFHFLRHCPGITFITTPFLTQYAGREVAMLPHTKTPEKEWGAIDWLRKAELCFMHATVSGAIGENGMRLDGIPARVLIALRGAEVWSGDVHVPQIIEGVRYVGAPYPVRFGDKFDGRIVVLEGFRKQIDIVNDWAPLRRFINVRPTATGCTVDGLDDLHKHDQVKVRIQLAPHEYVDWQKCKAAAVEACERGELQLCGLELQRIVEKARTLVKKPVHAAAQSVRPEENLSVYCARNSIDGEVATVGKQLLSAAQQS